jgi:phospholipid/cholesterol/gamma-HCH transport system substrate-binding protein
MKEEIRHTFIGMATLVVVLLVAVISFSSSKIEAPTGTAIKAVFNQIDGLSIGDDVRMGGVIIGEVIKMDLGEGYAAHVWLRINQPNKLPEDTSAAIHTDGLFGRKYITLEPGGDEAYLGNGDEISMTQDSVVVQDILELIIGEAKAKRAKNIGNR